MGLTLLAVIVAVPVAPFVAFLVASVLTLPIRRLESANRHAFEFARTAFEGAAAVAFAIAVCRWMEAPYEFLPALVLAVGFGRNDAKRLRRNRQAWAAALNHGPESPQFRSIVPDYMASIDAAGWRELEVLESGRLLGHVCGVFATWLVSLASYSGDAEVSILALALTVALTVAVLGQMAKGRLAEKSVSAESPR